jgi:hypothetical protein
VNIKAFFSDALGQALDLGIGTPEDVVKHVTPDLLAAYLPKPLWARLLTACLGASRVDATLVVETIGVPNLCEHIPAGVIWGCISEIAARSLGQAYAAPTRPPIVTRPIVPTSNDSGSMLAPPPDAIDAPTALGTSPGSVGPSIPSPTNGPLADLITELEADERPITPTRARTPTSQRFRQSNTGIGRLGQSQAAATPPAPQPRRPQAAAAAPTPAGRPRRTGTEVEEGEAENETRAGREIAVDDSQLVDWQSTETTQTADGDDFSDIGGRNKR